MKFKKIILLSVSILSLFSCNSDDDSTSEPVIDANPIENSINTNFLLNEEWTISSITASIAVDETGDGNDSTNTLSQNEDCILDDIFIFSNQSNQLVLNLFDNENICEDFVTKYGASGNAELFIESTNNSEENIESIAITGNITFPGLFCSCSTLNNIEGTNNNGDKRLTGSINVLRGGRDVTYTYILTN